MARQELKDHFALLAFLEVVVDVIQGLLDNLPVFSFQVQQTLSCLVKHPFAHDLQAG